MDNGWLDREGLCSRMPSSGFGNGGGIAMRRIRAFLRLVWSLLVTAAVLGGTAALLLYWVGPPLPDHVPSSAEMEAFADDPLASALGRVVLAFIAWLFWLGLAAAVALQAWVHRSRRPVRLHLPRPLQMLTAGLYSIGVLNLANPTHAHDVGIGTSAAVTGDHTAPHTQASASASPPAPNTADTSTGSGRVHDGAPDGTPRSHGHHGGVALPDGWIAWPTAGGILATTAAALLNGTHAQSASALVRHIRAARHPDTDPDAPETGEPVADDITLLEQDAATQTGLHVAVADGGYLAVQELPRSGVGLAGPGAADALRGLLAAAAVASPPATVVIPGDLLYRLTADAPDLPNVVIAADTDYALHHVQLQIGTRYIATASPSPTNGHPPTIVMTSPAADDARLTALAVLGHDLNVYIVIDGPWSGGVTWQVDDHGYATEDDTIRGRLNTLSQQGIRELAALLRPSPTTATAASSLPPRTTLRPRLHLCILGQPQLTTTPSQQAVKLRRSGAWQIATYLALHPDGASRTDLIEQIFGDMKTADAAATSLNTCLHELRRALTVDQQSALLTLHGGYRLDHNQISVDWWNLQDLLHHGDLAAAVALYRGPIAQGYRWDWLPEHRQTARRIVADAYALLADTANDPDRALDLALAGIGVNPHGQDCYAAAIQAHLQMDNINGAELLYRNLEQRLSRSGAPPDTKIIRLLQAHPDGSQPAPVHGEP